MRTVRLTREPGAGAIEGVVELLERALARPRPSRADRGGRGGRSGRQWRRAGGPSRPSPQTAATWPSPRPGRVSRSTATTVADSAYSSASTTTTDPGAGRGRAERHDPLGRGHFGRGPALPVSSERPGRRPPPAGRRRALERQLGLHGRGDDRRATWAASGTRAERAPRPRTGFDGPCSFAKASSSAAFGGEHVPAGPPLAGLRQGREEVRNDRVRHLAARANPARPISGSRWSSPMKRSRSSAGSSRARG